MGLGRSHKCESQRQCIGKRTKYVQNLNLPRQPALGRSRHEYILARRARRIISTDHMQRSGFETSPAGGRNLGAVWTRPMSSCDPDDEGRALDGHFCDSVADRWQGLSSMGHRRAARSLPATSAARTASAAVAAGQRRTTATTLPGPINKKRRVTKAWKNPGKIYAPPVSGEILPKFQRLIRPRGSS